MTSSSQMVSLLRVCVTGAPSRFRVAANVVVQRSFISTLPRRRRCRRAFSCAGTATPSPLQLSTQLAFGGGWEILPLREGLDNVEGGAGAVDDVSTELQCCSVLGELGRDAGFRSWG